MVMATAVFSLVLGLGFVGWGIIQRARGRGKPGQPEAALCFGAMVALLGSASLTGKLVDVAWPVYLLVGAAMAALALWVVRYWPRLRAGQPHR